MLAEADVVDSASSRGEAACLSLSGSEGLVSGVLAAAGEDEASEAGPGRALEDATTPFLRKTSVRPATAGERAAATHENFPAACLVTAAAMPPCSLACFLSFLEPVQSRRQPSGHGSILSRDALGIQLVFTRPATKQSVSCSREKERAQASYQAESIHRVPGCGCDVGDGGAAVTEGGVSYRGAAIANKIEALLRETMGKNEGLEWAPSRDGIMDLVVMQKGSWFDEAVEALGGGGQLGLRGAAMTLYLEATKSAVGRVNTPDTSGGYLGG